MMYAQGIRITGKVLDDFNKEIPGVSVVVRGTTNGTTSDANGEFALTVSSDTCVLRFSYIGYETKEVAVGKQRVISVTMKEATQEMEEVVVVAFGTQKKASAIASIETVNTKDLKISSSNLTTAFAGKIPGIISYQASGEPGKDNAQFFVRGVTTFGYKADPLILIDGFEATTNDLARLQPDDIESFSILKDASATVLYGARGANGIIAVSTKKGVEGPVKVSVRLDANVAAPTTMLELLDGVEYMQLYNQARVSRDRDRAHTLGEKPIGAWYGEEKIQATMRGENPMIYPNINWYDQLFKQYTINTKANINLQGGGKVATYYVAGGYDHETGILKIDKLNNYNNNIDINRFNIRSNVIFKLSATTTLDTRVQGRFERYNGPYTTAGDIFNQVMDANPVDFPAMWIPDEKYKNFRFPLFGNIESMKWNPYAEMVRGYEERNENTITAQATLMQDLDMLLKGLKVQLKASINTWSYHSGKRTAQPLFFALEQYDAPSDTYTLYRLNPDASGYLGDVEGSRDGNTHSYFEGRVNWNGQYGPHNVGIMTVGIAEEFILSNGKSGTIYETLPERNLGNSGRLTYDYDNRYFFEFTYGYNGSEKFTGKKRFGFFPSYGIGWLVSNENFWERIDKYLLISLLKIKFTYGRVGNDAIAERSGRFFYLSDIRDGGSNYVWGKTFSNSYLGYSVYRYGNPDIGWEESTKYNLGFELGLFKSEALKFQIDLFYDIRDKIYWNRESIPSIVGLEAGVAGNVGRVSSKGIDASLDYKHSFTPDFWMTGRANFTFATNKVEAKDEPNYQDKYLSGIGYPINKQWGLVAERLFIDQNEIDNSPSQLAYGTYMRGDIKYADMNKDGVINDNDRIPMGYPSVPEIQYGFGLSTGYKNLDLSFFCQGNARVHFSSIREV
jgi:TonB-linked SusC/RagA family outer membrane protein